MSKIYERSKKIVITGRKVIFDYPYNNNKTKIQKIIKKKDDDTIDYHYSDTNDENI